MTRARRAPPHSCMPSAIRSNERPRGLPHLSAADRRTLNRGNALADRAFHLENLCYHRHIPGGEENPGSSFLWLQRNRVAFAAQDRVTHYIVHMCACGTPYRKSTRLQLWNWQDDELKKMRCNGTRTACGHTGRRHIVLSGCRDRQFATKAAQTYPPLFCSKLADMIVRALVRRRLVQLWDPIC